MAYAVAAPLSAARVDAQPNVPEDPLDMQGLWPITTDVTNHIKRIATDITPLARALSQDESSAAPSLRQRLLEIRARLAYVIDHISVHIISLSSQLMSTTSHAIADNLRRDPSADAPGDLAHLLASTLDGCTTSRLLVNDCLSAWLSLAPTLGHFQESKQSNSMSSFLRTFGAFSAPAPPSLPAASSQKHSSATDVETHITKLLQSLDRIEAFWRKREALFSGAGYTFSHDQLLRFHKSCNLIGEAYMDFVDPLGSSQLEISNVQPFITKSANVAAKTTRIQLAWRDLLPE